MLKDLKEVVKAKCKLSDTQLHWLTRAMKFSALWCASGVLCWGILAAAGGVALGLHALGVGIPHFLGVSSVVTGTLMAAKSVLLRHGFNFLHKKCVKEKDDRLQAVAMTKVLQDNAPGPGLAPNVAGNLPAANTVLAKAALQKTFNPEAGIILVVVKDPAAKPSGLRFAPLRRAGVSFPRSRTGT